ncbi:nuclear transport factor 2 family protein [Streptococcus dentiloxodontae]
MKNKLFQLEQGFLNPSSQSNQDWLNRTIHDDFIEIGKSGRIYNKQEVIAALTDRKTGEIAEMLKFDCRQIDRKTWLVHYQTKHSALSAYRTSIWLTDEADPQLYFHQATKQNLANK